jgi:adenylate cyclase
LRQQYYILICVVQRIFLNKHNKASVAKMHMAYFHTLVKIAKSLGGEVRSFNGDSMLVFFQGTTKQTLSNAVQAAMQMKYMITNSQSGINKYLTQYSALNFGIGLDDGEILCTKIGLGGDSNNQDLMWIGNCVNKSTAISDKCQDPNHIWDFKICLRQLN